MADTILVEVKLNEKTLDKEIPRVEKKLIGLSKRLSKALELEPQRAIAPLKKIEAEILALNKQAESLDKALSKSFKDPQKNERLVKIFTDLGKAAQIVSDSIKTISGGGLESLKTVATGLAGAFAKVKNAVIGLMGAAEEGKIRALTAELVKLKQEFIAFGATSRASAVETANAIAVLNGQLLTAIQRQKELSQSRAMTPARVVQPTTSGAQTVSVTPVIDTRALERGLKMAQKDLKKSLETFRMVDVVQVDGVTPIKTVATLRQALLTNSRELNAILSTGARNMMSNQIAEIQAGERQLLHVIAEGTRRQQEAVRQGATSQIAHLEQVRSLRMNALKAAQQAELAQAQAAGRNIQDLERQHNQARLDLLRQFVQQKMAIERQAAEQSAEITRQSHARQAAVQRTSQERQTIAPTQTEVGRLGNTPILSQLRGGVMAELSAGMEGLAGRAGALGSVLGKLGPVGMAVGAGIGAMAAGITAAVHVVAKAVDEFQKFEFATAKVSTLLNERQELALPGAMQDLGRISSETGEKMGNLQSSMFTLISAAPQLAGNLGAANVILEKSAKASVGLGADVNQTTIAFAQLAGALGLSVDDAENVDFIFDRLAATMKEGLIPNGADLAANISRNASMFGLFVDGSKEALNGIGAMTSILTTKGIPSMAEAQTHMKALIAELTDTEKAGKLAAAGLKGFEDGKIKDLPLVFKSMAQNLNAVLDIMGSQEADKAAAILSMDGGRLFEESITKMRNAGGTAGEMYEDMAATGEKAMARLQASIEHVWVSLGEKFSPAKNEVVAGLTEIAHAFGEMFASAESKYNQAMKVAQGANQSIVDIGLEIETVQGIMASGDFASPTAEQSLQRIAKEAKDLTGISEDAKTIINQVLNDTSLTTEQRFTKLNEVLATTQGALKNIAAVESMNAAEAGLAGVSEKIDGMNTTLDDFIPKWLAFVPGLPQLALGVAEVFETNNDQFFDSINENLEKNKARITEIDGLLQAQAGTEEELNALQAERQALQVANMEIGFQQLTIESQIQKSASDSVKALVERNIAQGQGLDKAAMLDFLTKKMPPEIANSTAAMAIYNQELDKAIAKADQIRLARERSLAAPAVVADVAGQITPETPSVGPAQAVDPMILEQQIQRLANETAITEQTKAQVAAIFEQNGLYTESLAIAEAQLQNTTLQLNSLTASRDTLMANKDITDEERQIGLDSLQIAIDQTTAKQNQYNVLIGILDTEFAKTEEGRLQNEIESLTASILAEQNDLENTGLDGKRAKIEHEIEHLTILRDTNQAIIENLTTQLNGIADGSIAQADADAAHTAALNQKITAANEFNKAIKEGVEGVHVQTADAIDVAGKIEKTIAEMKAGNKAIDEMIANRKKTLEELSKPPKRAPGGGGRRSGGGGRAGKSPEIREREQQRESIKAQKDLDREREKAEKDRTDAIKKQQEEELKLFKEKLALEEEKFKEELQRIKEEQNLAEELRKLADGVKKKFMELMKTSAQSIRAVVDRFLRPGVVSQIGQVMLDIKTKTTEALTTTANEIKDLETAIENLNKIIAQREAREADLERQIAAAGGTAVPSRPVNRPTNTPFGADIPDEPELRPLAPTGPTPVYIEGADDDVFDEDSQSQQAPSKKKAPPTTGEQMGGLGGDNSESKKIDPNDIEAAKNYFTALKTAASDASKLIGQNVIDAFTAFGAGVPDWLKKIPQRENKFLTEGEEKKARDYFELFLDSLLAQTKAVASGTQPKPTADLSDFDESSDKNQSKSGSGNNDRKLEALEAELKDTKKETEADRNERLKLEARVTALSGELNKAAGPTKFLADIEAIQKGNEKLAEFFLQMNQEFEAALAAPATDIMARMMELARERVSSQMDKISSDMAAMISKNFPDIESLLGGKVGFEAFTELIPILEKDFERLAASFAPEKRTIMKDALADAKLFQKEVFSVLRELNELKGGGFIQLPDGIMKRFEILAGPNGLLKSFRDGLEQVGVIGIDSFEDIRRELSETQAVLEPFVAEMKQFFDILKTREDEAKALLGPNFQEQRFDVITSSEAAIAAIGDRINALKASIVEAEGDAKLGIEVEGGITPQEFDRIKAEAEKEIRELEAQEGRVTLFVGLKLADISAEEKKKLKEDAKKAVENERTRKGKIKTDIETTSDTLQSQTADQLALGNLTKEEALKQDIKDLQSEINKLEREGEDSTKARVEQAGKENELLEERVRKMNAFFNFANRALDEGFGEEGSTAFDFFTALDSKDVGGAISAAGAGISELGEKMKDAGMGATGAFLMGLGKVAELVGRVFSIFQVREKSRLELAKEHARAQDELLAIYEAQNEALDRAVELGDTQLDQAFERLEAEREIFNLMVAQSALLTDLNGLSDEQLASKRASAEADQAFIENIQGALSDFEEFGLGNRERADRLAGDRDQLEALLGEEFINDIFDAGLITDVEMERLGEALNSLGLETDDLIEGIDTVQQSRINEIERMAEIFEERLGQFEFQIELGVDTERTVARFEKDLAKLRSFQTEGFRALGVELGLSGDPARMKEQLIALLSDPEAQLSAEQIERIQSLMGIDEIIEGGLSDLVQRQIDELELRSQIAPTDEDFLPEQEANQAILDLLQDQLETAEDIGASELYILDLKKQIFELQKEMNAAGDDALNNLIKQRQAILANARADGTMTAQEQATLSTIEAQIRARLAEIGVPAEQIEKIIQDMQLQRFKQGGLVPGSENQAVPILAHGKEYVLSAPDVKALGGAKGIEQMLSMAKRVDVDRLRAMLSPQNTNSVSQILTIGDINVYAKDPAQFDTKFRTELRNIAREEFFSQNRRVGQQRNIPR